MSLFKPVVQSNVHRIVRSFGAILLIASLFTPAVALPDRAFVSGIATFGSSGTWSPHLAAELIGSLLTQNAFPTVVGALISSDSPAKKAGKNLQFDRIVIKPGDQTVLQGETLNFVAIAYNGDQPVAGMDFRWTVSEANNNRPEREFRNGRLRTNKPGRLIVKASAQGRYAAVQIDVKPNHGMAVAKLLTKNESERTPAERQKIAQWRANGTLWSREAISSKKIYSIAEERALYEADKLKRQRAMQHPMDPPKGPPSPVSAKPANSEVTLAQRDLFPFADQTVKRTRGPSAEEVENIEERYLESMSSMGAPMFWLSEPLGWDGANWSLADDRNNWTGKPAGATQDAGAGNGNFTFAAPAVSLPGRGIDINLNLHYNSRLWSDTGGTMTYNADAGYPAPGWSLGFGRMYYLGSTGGCMLVTPDGTRQSYDPVSNQVYNSGGVYQHHYSARTMDGSFIDYSCSYYSSGSYTSLYGTAKLSDGTIISYGSRTSNSDQIFPTQIIDAHGNYINISYVNNQGPEIDTILDTLGRTLTFTYSSGRLIKISGPGYNGSTRTYLNLEYTAPFTLEYNFTGFTPSVNNASPSLIKAIYYPTTNTGYWFGDTDSYSSYGMIAKVMSKRGMSENLGVISGGTMTKQDVYNYPMDASTALTAAPTYTSLTETWDTMDNGSTTACNSVTTSAAVTCYSVSTGTDEVITVTRPDGSISKQTSKVSGGNYDDGMWFQTEILNPSSTVLNKTKIYMQQGTGSTEYSSARTTKIEHTDEKGQMTTTEFSYATNSYNQVAAQKEYGYGSTVYREKRFTYENNANYTYRHIFSLVKTVEDYDGSNNRLTRTEFTYDGGTPVAAPNVVQHDDTYDPYTESTQQGSCIVFSHPSCTYEGETWWEGDLMYFCQCTEYEQVSVFNPYTAFRGNLTSVTTYENAGTSPASNAITHDYTFDITGNQRTATTNCCQQIESTYSTATQFSQPDSITKGSSDTQSAHRMTQSFTYDTNTKVPTSVTDYNGDTTAISYDAILRPTVVTLNSGGKKTTTYNDSSLSQTELVQKSSGEGSGTVSNSTVYFNGRGQTIKSTYQAGATNHNGTSIKYDVMGRQWKVSMPYETGSSPSNWTEFAYDHLSRMTQQTAADGSTSKMFYNEATRPDSASTTSGQSVRSQDAWGRERWTLADAFGRMIEAVEPNPGSTTAAVIGTESSGSLKTAYAYDQLDRLTQIDQGDQIRKFAYDSLGRLTRQKLAEQTASINAGGAYDPPNGVWSEAFVYDSRSNITQRTDARGVKTNFSYLISGSIDPLNRLQSISYDLSGPRDTTHTIHSAASVSLEYMTTGDRSRVKKVIANGVVTEENTFDGEGRISAYEMKFDNRTAYPFKTEYTYDTAHRLTQVKYPKRYGMTINSVADPQMLVAPSYDVASRLSRLEVDGAEQLSEIYYNARSQVTGMRIGEIMGGDTSYHENYSYDAQTGLLTGQGVSIINSIGNFPLLSLSYGYTRGGSAGTLSGKTGQMTHITDNLDRNRDRKYEFDAMGRLSKAKGGLAAGATSVTANWTQEYSYDRYGNKTGTTKTGITQDSNNVPLDGLASLGYNTATNRVNDSGWTYDLAGNLIRGQNASGVWQRFEYDAAGRLVKIRDDSSNLIETYTYGATRERLITTTSTQRIYYAWGGQSVICEYTEPIASSTPAYAKSYQYAGSRLVSTSTKASSTTETTEFHHPDRLGTRLVTNHAAGTAYQQSTLPFGTALGAETTGNSNQVFTSYDRSAGTGLDYAVNRTYSPGQSRFTQVDPIGMAATSLGNPQSNNLYAYVQNMPTDFVDPTGLDAIGAAVSRAQDLLTFAACGTLFRRGSNPSQVLGDIYRGNRIQAVSAIPVFTGTGIGRYRQVGSVPFGNNVAWTAYTTYTPYRGAPHRTNVGIYIDINGQFFNPQSSTTSIYSGSGVYISNSDRNALTMIHELMHWLNRAPGGTGHDARFNQAIYTRCFLLNPRWTGRHREPIVTTQTLPSGTITPRPLYIPPGGGGGGGGGSYGGFGGYPSWWHEMQRFLDWINSIEVGGGSVTVEACVGSDCPND